MRETRTTEFKEKITNTFLKTVSAFSNYDGGEIFFGIDDNGNVKGLTDVKQACLDIENKINDSITPQPDYTLELQNNDRTIKLTVKSGLQAQDRMRIRFTMWNLILFSHIGRAGPPTKFLLSGTADRILLCGIR